MPKSNLNIKGNNTMNMSNNNLEVKILHQLTKEAVLILSKWPG